MTFFMAYCLDNHVGNWHMRGLQPSFLKATSQQSCLGPRRASKELQPHIYHDVRTMFIVFPVELLRAFHHHLSILDRFFDEIISGFGTSN
jgi:hypothetical protein